MQLISDRPRRLASAGPSSPEGTSESDLVEFLESYTRLHVDDICAQRVDPSNLVAWVFRDGTWQVRRGLEMQKDSKSWCRVYLTSMLGLDPVQYERAKRELFTSNDGLTGVYRHKIRPAHALVYRPSRGLSTASIAAITAGSAAVAGVGGLVLRQIIANKKQGDQVPDTSDDSGERSDQSAKSPVLALADLQEFNEHIGKLKQSAENLNQYLSRNDAQVVDDSAEFVEFTKLLDDAKPFENKVPELIYAAINPFVDLATKIKALISARTTGSGIELTFNKSYADVIRSKLWTDHKLELIQYINLAGNDGLKKALLATQNYESIIKKPSYEWSSDPIIGEVLNRAEQEVDCADINKCPFKKLSMELRQDPSNRETFDNITIDHYLKGSEKQIGTELARRKVSYSDVAGVQYFLQNMLKHVEELPDGNLARFHLPQIQKQIKLIDRIRALESLRISENDAIERMRNFDPSKPGTDADFRALANFADTLFEDSYEGDVQQQFNQKKTVYQAKSSGSRGSWLWGWR